MKFKVAFIDIDNTLLDFDAYVIETLKLGFETLKLGEYSDHVYEVFTKINTKLWKQLEDKEITFPELKRIRFSLVFKELGIDYDGIAFETFFRERLFYTAIPIEGAYDLLKDLKNKCILCTASNGPYEQQINRLTVCKMINYFDYNFISEKIGYSKPSKEFFVKALEIINENRNDKINLDECVMIGDSMTSDMNGAFNAGTKSIFFNKHKKNFPADERVDYYVNELKEISNIIE